MNVLGEIIQELTKYAELCRSDEEDGEDISGLILQPDIVEDAIFLLKAQEPRLLTEADFENNPLVDQNGKLPAWCEHKSLDGIAHDVDGWTTINQGWVCGYKYQRYWSAQPTDEQRKKVPWNV